MKIRKLYLNWLLIHLAFVVLFIGLVFIPMYVTKEHYVPRFHLGSILAFLMVFSGTIWVKLFFLLVKWLYNKANILVVLLLTLGIPVGIFLLFFSVIVYLLSGISYSYQGSEGDKVYITGTDGCWTTLRTCEVKGMYYHVLSEREGFSPDI